MEILENFNLAMNFYNRKSYNIAISYFMQTLRLDNQHRRARYFLSQSFYKIGKNQEASRELENLMRLQGVDRYLEKRINFFNQQRFLDQKRSYQNYIWIRDFPIPELSNTKFFDYSIQTPIDLWVNPDNELLVLDFSLKRFFKLGGEGNYLDSFLSGINNSSYYLIFSSPWSFVETSDGYWISDFYKDMVKKIDFNGQEILTIGEKGTGPKQFLGPKGLAIDENQNLYVVDSGNARIQFWNQRGEWLDDFGRRGRDSDALLNPVDVSYDKKRKQLFVLDKGNKKVLRYSSEKKFLSTLDNLILEEPQKLYLNHQDDFLYVLDKTQVYRYNLNRDQSQLLQITKKEKNLPTHFTSLAVGQDDYLYLGNSLSQSIEVYSPTEKSYVNLPVMINQVNIREFPVVQIEVSVKDLGGHPISFLRANNFRVHENKTQLRFKLVPPSQLKRFILLVEKSSFTEQKKLAIQAFMDNLFDQIQSPEGIKLITYNQHGFEDKTPFNTFKLATIEKALQGDYTPSFRVEGALTTAVKKSYNPRFKNAIILLTFSPHSSRNFANNSYSQTLQLVKNNDVPVFVFYAGSEQDSQSLFYLSNLAQQSGGKFYFYDEKSLQQFKSDFDARHNGVYHLQYVSAPNPNAQGVFREVGVEIFYKNSHGEDPLAGYPLP